MSVEIHTPATQSPSLLQRIFGSEPQTVVRETSTTTITNDAGGTFDFRTALRNAGVGAGIAGVLGGVSLLGKVALPFIGKVASLSGLVRIAGVGGAVGAATAAIPLLLPAIERSPAAKAAVTGAAIGGVAGAVLPFLPVWLGAAVGAGAGLLVHHVRNNPVTRYPDVPGYAQYPGYVAVGPAGNYDGGAGYGSPYGAPMGLPYGYGSPAGFGAPGPYGYGSPMMLPMSPTAPGAPVAAPGVPAQAAQPGVAATPTAAPTPVVAPPGYPALTGLALPTVAPMSVATPAPSAASSTLPAIASAPKHPGAKTFRDGAGNIRQVGTGIIVKPAAGNAAATSGATAPTATLTAMPSMPSMPGIGAVETGASAPISASGPTSLPAMPVA